MRNNLYATLLEAFPRGGIVKLETAQLVTKVGAEEAHISDNVVPCRSKERLDAKEGKGNVQEGVSDRIEREWDQTFGFGNQAGCHVDALRDVATRGA